MKKSKTEKEAQAYQLIIKRDRSVREAERITQEINKLAMEIKQME